MGTILNWCVATNLNTKTHENVHEKYILSQICVSVVYIIMIVTPALGIHGNILNHSSSSESLYIIARSAEIKQCTVFHRGDG